jgi:phosphatidylserine/phosphatidylglycerophosphate/cardiolipin synthase-like enzyme
MTTSQGQGAGAPIVDWWADGDSPVHTDARIAYYVDGRMFLQAFCRHLLLAQQYIYLANWGMTATMTLVRGTDWRAGPDGSPEQEALIAKLRAEGLAEPEIAFWTTQPLTLQNVLGYMVRKGVEVKVLIWDAVEEFMPLDPAKACELLRAVGVTCLLDDSSRGLVRHPTEALHQKMSVVDGLHAFVGGIDPLIEHTGDFDRWDTQAHLYANPLRANSLGQTGHPWHDVHTHVMGPAAGDVERNFRQRWNDVVKRHNLNAELLVPEHPLAPPMESEMVTQVARTIPPDTYSFAPQGIQGIAQLYNHAFSNAQSFIYLENQYFWYRAYTGLDIPFLGPDSPDMERNIHDIAGALQRGASFAIVLPDHPNVGRAFTDAGLKLLHSLAPQADLQGKIQAFCLGTSTQEPGEAHYRPIYVHAKVAIIDDLWSTNGSANLNNRGMRNDAEINAAALDTRLAHGLRMLLWAEHLSLLDEERLFELGRLLSQEYLSPQEQARAIQSWQYLQETIGDPQIGMRLLVQRAWENLQRYKAKQPLIGHLLPYLTAEQATEEGLPFQEKHGWIEEVPSPS